jgi:hypothetical protein
MELPAPSLLDLPHPSRPNCAYSKPLPLPSSEPAFALLDRMNMVINMGMLPGNSYSSCDGKCLS